MRKLWLGVKTKDTSHCCDFTDDCSDWTDDQPPPAELKESLTPRQSVDFTHNMNRHGLEGQIWVVGFESESEKTKGTGLGTSATERTATRYNRSFVIVAIYFSSCGR